MMFDLCTLKIRKVWVQLFSFAALLNLSFVAHSQNRFTANASMRYTKLLTWFTSLIHSKSLLIELGMFMI